MAHRSKKAEKNGSNALYEGRKQPNDLVTVRVVQPVGRIGHVVRLKLRKSSAHACYILIGYVI